MRAISSKLAVRIALVLKLRGVAVAVAQLCGRDDVPACEDTAHRAEESARTDSTDRSKHCSRLTQQERRGPRLLSGVAAVRE